MAINREELFAPIACVIRAKDYEHALSILNDTNFGLTAGIVTQSLATASDFKKRAVSGCVMVNPADSGNRLSCALRRAKGLQLWPARAGPVRA
jgi:aldehyde dehydrogenase (NAD+)